MDEPSQEVLEDDMFKILVATLQRNTFVEKSINILNRFVSDRTRTLQYAKWALLLICKHFKTIRYFICNSFPMLANVLHFCISQGGWIKFSILVARESVPYFNYFRAASSSVSLIQPLWFYVATSPLRFYFSFAITFNMGRVFGLDV